MPVTATALQEPFGPSTFSSHPIFAWYYRYAVDFDTARTTTPPTNYYAATATIVHPDGSSTSGASQIWDYYTALYGQFERCSHKLISATVVTNDQTGKHTLFIEVETGLHLKGGEGTVPLPQGSVYEIAEAESGQGTDGLQIWKLRCYFDKGLLRKAADM